MFNRTKLKFTAVLVGFAVSTAGSVFAADCVASLDADKTTGPELIDCIVEMHGELVALRDELKPFRDAKGAVLAFDRSGAATADATAGYCPPGWEWFEASGGRMLIGAGIHKDNVDQNDKRLRRYPSFLEDPKDAIGGAETHVLEVNEMPAHSHDLGTLAVDKAKNFMHATADKAEVSSNYRVPGPLFTADAGRRNFGEHSHNLTGSLGTTGGGQDGVAVPHNNMPPYVALYFCKKKASNGLF